MSGNKWKPKKNFGLVISFFVVASFLMIATPVFANYGVGTVYGTMDYTSPSRLTLAALLLVLVSLIEAVIFYKMLGATFKHALLTSFVINIISGIFGWLAPRFEIPATIMAGPFDFLPLLIITIIYHWGGKGEVWITGTGWIAVLIGAALNMGSAFVWPPQEPSMVLYMMLVPLILAFGVTLIVESVFFNAFYKYGDRWKAFIIANVSTYILLIFLLPFAGPNPYKAILIYQDPDFLRYESYNHNTTVGLRDSQQRAVTPELAVIRMQHRRAPVSYLLGRSDKAIPDGYDAKFEYDLLTWHSAYSLDREVMKAVCIDILTIPDLDPEFKSQVETLVEFIGCSQALSDAIKHDSQSELDSAAYKFAVCAKELGKFAKYHYWVQEYSGDFYIEFEHSESELEPPPGLEFNLHYLQMSYPEGHPELDPERGLITARELLADAEKFKSYSDLYELEGKHLDVPDIDELNVVISYFEYWVDLKETVEAGDVERAGDIRDEWIAWYGEQVNTEWDLVKWPDPESIAEYLMSGED